MRADVWCCLVRPGLYAGPFVLGGLGGVVRSCRFADDLGWCQGWLICAVLWIFWVITSDKYSNRK